MRIWVAARVACLALGLMAVRGACVGAQSGERYWIAGRYDRNRVIVYFDTVKFGPTDTTVKADIPGPRAEGFFNPGSISAAFAAKVDTNSGAEHFSLGDRYDLLLDNGVVTTVTITTLVGAAGDEQVGNNSYIGALATLDDSALVSFTNGYHVLRRHAAQSPGQHPARIGLSLASNPLLSADSTSAGRRMIAKLLHDRLARYPVASVRAEAARLPLAIAGAQTFHIAAGQARYYVRAKLKGDSACTRVSAWMTATPTPRVLATAAGSCRWDYPQDDPPLLNVVELAPGRLGIIALFQYEDGIELRLVEYRDGRTFDQMRVLQSLSAGE